MKPGVLEKKEIEDDCKSRRSATLFFFGLFGFLRKVQKKTFCKNFFVWEREFFSEASTAEIEPVVTKKDDLDYRVELFLLVPSKMFGILGFWFKQ